MATIRLTKEFSFEMAHTLTGYDGACSEIHGHSYKLFVTVAGQPQQDEKNPKLGMVMDFGVIKKIVGGLIVERYDHSFMISDVARNRELIAVLRGRFHRIEVVDYQPTCENMATHFAAMISAALPEGIKLVGIRLHETATSFAEWLAEDNG